MYFDAHIRKDGKEFLPLQFGYWLQPIYRFLSCFVDLNSKIPSHFVHFFTGSCWANSSG